MDKTQSYALPPRLGVVERTPTESLRVQELPRLRTFAAIAFLLCVIGFPFHYSNPRTPILHTLASIGFGVFALMSAIVWLTTYRARPFPRALIRAYAHVGLVIICVFLFYMGLFSPVVVALVFGISFFALGERVRVVISDVVAVILFYSALGLAMSFDLVPDVGIFSAASVPRSARITMVALVAGVSLFALLQARASRRSTEEAIARAAAVAREIEQREAQLREAHENLAVLRAATGGRYTDAMFGGWRIGEILGRGAMGEVYAAMHVTTGERAAVKVLNTFAADDPKLVRRFIREAEITSKLRGEHIVRVFEAGETIDGTPFIAMERLDGTDLRTVLGKEPRLDPERAVHLVEQVARGLETAHSAGVVHRDLKPANIFRAKRGEREIWTIVDFGIAKLPSGAGTLTHGDIVGTPGYMAPEQVLGQASDHRVDVFSLGAVAYRVLTGYAPFEGATMTALHAVVFDGPRRPRELVPSLPADVERVLAIALAKDPALRFDSAVAFAAALRAAVASELSPALRERADMLAAERAWRLAA